MLQEFYGGSKAIREFLHKGSTAGSVCPRLTASLRVSADQCRRHEREKMSEKERRQIRAGENLRSCERPPHRSTKVRHAFAELAREGNPFESRRFPKAAVALSQADRAERPGQRQGPT